MRRKVGDHRLHLTNEGTVWLNTEVQDFDGLCIGAAGTMVDSIDDAIATTLRVVQALKVMRVLVGSKEPERVDKTTNDPGNPKQTGIGPT